MSPEDWDGFVKKLHAGDLSRGKADSAAANIQQRVKDQAKVLSVDKLRAGGTQFVRVLDPASLAQIVGDAIAATLDRHVLLDDDDRDALTRSARTEFKTLLADHQKMQRAKDDSDRERMSLERRLDQLQKGLEAQQNRLGKEREKKRERDQQLQFRPETFDEMDRRLRGLLTRMGELGELSTDEQGQAAFAENLGEMVRRVIRLEREVHYSEADEQQSEVIELLERRIAKLARTLEETHDALTHLSRAEGDPRTAPAPRPTQGLSANDPKRDMKRGMLQSMWRENLEPEDKAPPEVLSAPDEPTDSAEGEAT